MSDRPRRLEAGRTCAGRLHAPPAHANIAQVFTSFRYDSQLYIAMELCSGGGLARWLESHPNLRDRARAMRDIANGMACAHDRGIIHRDLKPTNILLSDTSAQAAFKIIDFDLAKNLDAADDHTKPDAVLGTYEYMSPEQATGNSRDVRPHSDVFSLGVILYEMLTGQRPFKGLTPADTRNLIANPNADPEPPRRFNRQVPKNLEQVCLKCLRKSPAERYQNAGELVADLDRFLDPSLGRVKAKSQPLLRRARKWVRTHPVTVAVPAVLTALLILVAYAAYHYQRLNAALARETADRKVNRYLNSLISADVELSENQNFELTRQLLNECPDELRGWEYYHLRQWADHSDSRSVVPCYEVGPPNPRRGNWMATASPDGTRVAVATITEGVRLYTTADGFHRATLNTPKLGSDTAPVFGVAFNSAGTLLAVATVAPSIKDAPVQPVAPVIQIWDLTKSHATVRYTLYGHTDFIHGVMFHPTRDHVVSGGYDGQIKLWDAVTGTFLKTVGKHSGWVNAVAFNAAGDQFVSAGADGVVKVWGTDDCHEVRAFPTAHRGPAMGAVYDPKNPDQIASVGMDSAVRIWNVKTNSLVREMFGHPGPAMSIAFSADGSRLASAGFDRTIRVWDPASGRTLLTLRGHDEMIWSVEFTRDGSDTLLSTGFDATLRLWRAATPPEGRTRAPSVPLPEAPHVAAGSDLTNDVAYSPAGDRYAVTAWGGVVTVYGDPGSTPLELRRNGKPAHDGPVWRAAWSPKGDIIATASWDRTVRLWDSATGAMVHEYPAGVGGHAVAFSPDGTKLVIGTIEGMITVWKTTGELERSLSRDTPYLTYAVGWSPDGRFIAAAGYTPGLFVWDSTTGDRVATLGVPSRLERLTGVVKNPAEKYAASVHQLAFSPDGKHLATASWDKKVLLWKVPGAGEVWPDSPVLTTGHTDYATALVFSPDSRTLASGGLDRQVRFWDVGTGEAVPVATPVVLRGPVWGLSWHPRQPTLRVANWYRREGLQEVAVPTRGVLLKPR